MKYIVCFTESPNRGLWKLFTFWRKGFGHVFIVRFDPEYGQWHRIECASERMRFDVLEGDKADLLVGMLIEQCKCLEVTGSSYPIQLPRWLYCVSFAKHVIGMNKPFVLTPYQLYCELRKRGAESIFEAE